jgi:hypothetical protein
LNFPLLSDFNKDVIAKYGVVNPDMIGLKDIAKRSVFVIDKGGVVRHREVLEDARNEPNYDEDQTIARKSLTFVGATYTSPLSTHLLWGWPNSSDRSTVTSSPMPETWPIRAAAERTLPHNLEAERPSSARSWFTTTRSTSPRRSSTARLLSRRAPPHLRQDGGTQ